LQALPVLRQLAALHQPREYGVAVVAIAVFAGEAQPEDQQQAPALCFKGAEKQAVAIGQTQAFELGVLPRKQLGLEGDLPTVTPASSSSSSAAMASV
jgi:hypothetical protein